jgi:hypothetical membrane protein
LNWLKLCGACGIVAPVVAFTGITVSLALTLSEGDSISALSDLGVQQGVTGILFNLVLVISGSLILVFALGLFAVLRRVALGKIGAFILVLDALALTAISVFPENVKPLHLYASVAFFALFPTSLFFIGTALLQISQPNLAMFTFLIAIIASLVWVIPFGGSVAVLETIATLSASTWSVVLGFRLLRQLHV